MRNSRLPLSQIPAWLPERGRCRRGATTLETALVVGAWTMVFVGIFDAGVTTMRGNTAAHLARQAARMTIVRGSQAGPELPVWGPTTRTVNLA
ncbi:MAG: TadE family protein, partial [Planctomycetaceae bacterium]